MSSREENLLRLEGTQNPIHNREYLVYYFLYKSLTYAINTFAKGNLLDIGCGNKPYAHWINPKVDSYLGCDIVQSSKNNVDILCPANAIPLDSNQFDTIISTQTIEHLGDYKGMLKEAFRLLKSGGRFIVSGPMYWPLHEEPYDFHRFTKHGFEFELKNAGFEELIILPNGGKWALMGQVIAQTLPTWLVAFKLTRILHNKFYKWLDEKYFDPSNTMNYVVIAKKV
jgi:SAM-dependent methyltransferase